MRNEARHEPLLPIAGTPVPRIRVSGPARTLYVRQSDEPSTLARLLMAS